MPLPPRHGWRRLAGAALVPALLLALAPSASALGLPAARAATAVTAAAPAPGERVLHASWTSEDEPGLVLALSARTLTLTLPAEVDGLYLPQGLTGSATTPEIAAQHTFRASVPVTGRTFVVDVPELFRRVSTSGTPSKILLRVEELVPDVGPADDLFLDIEIDVVGDGPADVVVDLSADTAGYVAGLDPVGDYVRTVYADLFGRDPDPDGLAAWKRALTSGTPYGAVADGITYSTEFRSTLIQDAYAYYLDREADPVGLGSWLEAMSRGMHIQQMEAGFLASAEYYARAGGTDERWVRSLYLDVLGREAGSGEVRSWVDQARRAGRVSVAAGFLYSDEHLGYVLTGYYGWLLGRGIDPVGQRAWTSAIQAGHRTEAVVSGIIASAEYRSGVYRR